ncbi:MAG TPA: hypothetical protein VMX75_12355, partial [Spirochaetia bacterium]|nr:hypothetical protein [Spirochaetia bacterium]
FSRLTIQLQNRGWSDEEIRGFRQTASRFQWEQANKADPAIVAFALQYQLRSGIELQVQQRTQLAFELSLAVQEMKALGYQTQEMTRTALRATRDVALQLQVDGERTDPSGIGDMIRDTIRTRLHSDECDLARLQTRERIGRWSESSGYKGKYEDMSPGKDGRRNGGNGGGPGYK